MADNKQTVISKRIGLFFYKNNKHLGKPFTLNDFMAEEFARSSI
jgi:hypothetical protein